MILSPEEHWLGVEGVSGLCKSGEGQLHWWDIIYGWCVGEKSRNVIFCVERGRVGL